MQTSPLSDPRLVRILRSGQAALPITSGFWGDLARGLGSTESELAADLGALQGDGIVLGAWGEPNPARPGTRESLVVGAPPSGATIRWSAIGPDGVVIASVLDAPSPGWPGGQCIKVGCMVDWQAEARGEGPMEPSRDRTPMVKEPQEKRDPALTETHQRVEAALRVPAPLVVGQCPWSDLARRAATESAEAARQCIGQLIIGQRLRRFGLALDLSRAGLADIGIATWPLDGADALGAANALASRRGALEVLLRPRHADRPASVWAILGSSQPGAARAMAENASKQWRIALGDWTALRHFRMGCA